MTVKRDCALHVLGQDRVFESEPKQSHRLPRGDHRTVLNGETKAWLVDEPKVHDPIVRPLPFVAGVHDGERHSLDLQATDLAQAFPRNLDSSGWIRLAQVIVTGRDVRHR